MKFNKTIYLFFAVFFLMTKIGTAFNLHYCGGSIAEISSVFTAEKGCGPDEIIQNPLSDCDDTLSQKSCCDDEVIIIQNDDKNPLIDKIQLSGDQLVAVLNAALFFHLIELPSSNTIIATTYQSNSHSPPLYKLYCNYTFYA